MSALSAERDEIASVIKANNELERQRRLANGEDAAAVNSDIDARNASDERFEKARKASIARQKAENALNAEREKAKQGESAVNKLMEDRRKLVADIHKRAQTVWAEENKFATNNGIRLRASEESALMVGRDDKDCKAKLEQLKKLNEQISAEQEAQAKREASFPTRPAQITRRGAAREKSHPARRLLFSKVRKWQAQ